MLSYTCLFIEGILSEQIILGIICTCWSLLLFDTYSDLFVVSFFNTLHRLLQVQVLCVEVTMCANLELLFCSNSCLILLPPVIASVHGPASWRQVDALVQPQLLMMLLRALLNGCSQTVISSPDINTTIHATLSSLSSNSSTFSEFGTSIGAIIGLDRG